MVDIAIVCTVVSAVIATLTLVTNRGNADKKEVREQAAWRGNVSATLEAMANSLSAIQNQLAEYQKEQGIIREDVAKLIESVHWLEAKYNRLNGEVEDLKKLVSK